MLRYTPALGGRLLEIYAFVGQYTQCYDTVWQVLSVYELWLVGALQQLRLSILCLFSNASAFEHLAEEHGILPDIVNSASDIANLFGAPCLHCTSECSACFRQPVHALLLDIRKAWGAVPHCKPHFTVIEFLSRTGPLLKISRPMMGGGIK